MKDYLQQLREQYRNAVTKEEKRRIVELAEQYKMDKFRCYFEENGLRCENYQEDYWCSIEHKNAWQKESYKDSRPRGQRKLTIREIQERLKRMSQPTKQLEL